MSDTYQHPITAH